MLTHGISAVVVGPERRTILTLDLDLYNRALQIQQAVGNTNRILRAGVLHIVFAALHALGKTVDGSGIDTVRLKVVFNSSSWNFWWQSIQAENGIPHFNQPSNYDDEIFPRPFTRISANTM